MQLHLHQRPLRRCIAHESKSIMQCCGEGAALPLNLNVHSTRLPPPDMP